MTMRALAAALGIVTASGPKPIPLERVLLRRRFMTLRAADLASPGLPAETLIAALPDTEVGIVDVNRVREWRNMPLYRFAPET